MITVHLYGALKDQYGPSYRLEVFSAAEAARALILQVDGFRDSIVRGSYRLVQGDIDQGRHLRAQELCLNLGGRDLHIVPATEGAKQGNSTGKIIMGVIIAAAAIYTGGQAFAALDATGAIPVVESGLGLEVIAGSGITYGNIASIGINMAITGISQLLTPTPKISNFSQFERPDQRPSFIFAGPVNVAHQGAAVPLVYGQMRVGSVVVSSGLSPEG